MHFALCEVVSTAGLCKHLNWVCLVWVPSAYIACFSNIVDSRESRAVNFVHGILFFFDGARHCF
jgi:hypothetical protein